MQTALTVKRLGVLAARWSLIPCGADASTGFMDAIAFHNREISRKT